MQELTIVLSVMIKIFIIWKVIKTIFKLIKYINHNKEISIFYKIYFIIKYPLIKKLDKIIKGMK